SEGALYIHFKGRLELLLAMLKENLPDMLRPLKTLQASVDRGSPHTNLLRALRAMFKFHRRILPATCGLFAEPELLVAYRGSLARQGKGPHLSITVLANYIAGEQKLARIDSDIDVKLAASVLMSSTFFHAFMEHFSSRRIQPSWDQFAKQLVTVI